MKKKNTPISSAGRSTGHGIRLRILNAVMIVTTIVFSLLMLFAGYQTMQSYTDMHQATEVFIACQQTAHDMQTGSDFLTEQVRQFVITGDPSCVDRYFEEVEVTRRRDVALERIRQYLNEQEAVRYLSEALEVSNALTSREYYAMRLSIAARGYDVADYHPSLRAVELLAADKAMSASEQQARAQEMVFDDFYQEHKDLIRQNVSACLDQLMGDTRAHQMRSTEELSGLLRQQEAMIALLLTIMLTIVLMTAFLVIRPLKRSIEKIRNNEHMPVGGAYEMRFLAQTYNRMFDENNRRRRRLSYEASHDGLTGLYNRGDYEKRRMQAEWGQVAMLLVDVDHFKTINDTYGHAAGDAILKKVAQVLRGSFRTDDYIFRSGGDEFAVVMIGADDKLKDLISKKIQTANQKMKETADGLPKATLSVGVAFGDWQQESERVTLQADEALYRVKKAGGEGCAFYE
ncbi:MAG: GGDEF domain-containing protein [Acutalibacteraceae bacterium]